MYQELRSLVPSSPSLLYEDASSQIMAPRILNLAERRAAQTALTRIVIYATLAIFVLLPPSASRFRSACITACALSDCRGCSGVHTDKDRLDKRIRLRSRAKRQQKSSPLRNSLRASSDENVWRIRECEVHCRAKLNEREEWWTLEVKERGRL